MTEPDGTSALSRPSPPRPWRRRRNTIILSIVLLLCGGVIGSGLTLMFVVRRVQYALHHPELFPARATARLRRALDLTDEQAKAVESVLRERQADLQDLRRDVQPRVEAQLDAAQEDIARLLNEEQRQKWNRLFEEKRRMWVPPPVPSSQPAATRRE